MSIFVNNKPGIFIRRHRGDDLPDTYNVMGASWDKGATPTLTRTDYAEGKTAQVGVDGGGATNHFDLMPIFRDIHDVEDEYGNIFMRFPKHYIKKTDDPWYRGVCLAHRPGFYRPYSFWDFAWNKELPYVDIAKYPASLSDDGQRLESKPGKYPLVNRTLPQMRTLAQNNNVNGQTGYQLLDIHGNDILDTLMYIEFATLNMQSVMNGYVNGRYFNTDTAVVAENGVNRIIVSSATGANYRVGQAISIHLASQSATLYTLPNTYGRTITVIDANTPEAGQTAISFDGAPVNIAVNDIIINSGWKNGFSAEIAASSGSIVSNSDGKYPCCYRGIENPYGNVFQWIDGVNVNDYQAWVCANANSYASNVFAHPYEQLGYINHNANNYIQAMGWDAEKPFAEFPVAVQASSVQYYCDYYAQNTGQRVARVGGSWSAGAGAGSVFWVFSSASSVAAVDIGARLLRKAS